MAFAGLRDLVGEAASEVLAELPAPQRHALAVVLLLEEPRADLATRRWSRRRS